MVLWRLPVALFLSLVLTHAMPAKKEVVATKAAPAKAAPAKAAPAKKEAPKTGMDC